MSQGITVQPGQLIERILTLELVRVTERAAVASARLRGRGNEKAADQAAVDAMRRELNRLPTLTLSAMKRVATPATTNRIRSRHGLNAKIGGTTHGTVRGLST